MKSQMRLDQLRVSQVKQDSPLPDKESSVKQAVPAEDPLFLLKL
jgi:hypothetical protein